MYLGFAFTAEQDDKTLVVNQQSIRSTVANGLNN